jgi:hypothetical protein
VPRLGRYALTVLEIIIILSALILAARCANYQDVFVSGNIYFTDADCYARMTRVRMCQQHPGLIVRHHDFENFPRGTTPHITALLDYLILALSILLRPFTTHSVDLAGALISPLLALIGGWFLWWWSRRMKFRYRWATLFLYAISPILVHGTALGRPDHQSLSMLLTTIAICAEWTLRLEPSERWSIVSGIAWGLAIWVSVYESLLLLVLVIVIGCLQDRQLIFGQPRRIGWIWFAAIIALALLIEQRVPSLSILRTEVFKNWSRTIGELLPISPLNPIWFRWAGWLLIATPFLIWFGFRNRRLPPPVILVLLIATYGLTIWQVRWAYFFISIFAIALPSLLAPIQSQAVVWIAFTLSIFPILRDWDERLWPNETEYARRSEQRHESMQLRDLALSLKSSDVRPVLAPWWLSPAIVYWSGQPGVAGSAHESLEGIADSARFFLAEDARKAHEILKKHEVAWVVAYDADRVAQNSAALLGVAVPSQPLCRTIVRAPAQAPRFLVLSAQNQACKLLRVVNNE